MFVAPVDDPDAAAALENALRTIMALVALDERRKDPLRLSFVGRDEARITALIAGDDPAASRVAFAVDGGRLVLGTDAEAVAAVIAGRGDDAPPRRPAARSPA